MATQADITREQFSIANVFELVNFAIRPYFVDTNATVVDDDGKTTQVPLTDFVLRCVAEEMKERWTGDDDNEKKVVEFAIQTGHYEDYVVPKGEMGGLIRKPAAGRRARKTRRRNT